MKDWPDHDHEPAGMNGGCLAFLLVFLACAAALWWAFGRQG